MLTGKQIRMALAGLRWTHAQLAKSAGLSLRTVQRAANMDGVPDMKAANLATIQAKLESAGCQFVEDGVICEAKRIRAKALQ